MTFKNDPTARRRVDGQAQRERDAEVARMRGDRVPFRRIAEELNMSLGAVQESLRRSQRRMTAALATGEPGDVLQALTMAQDAELKCADVQSVEDCERLSGLERYRLRHEPPPWGDWARAQPTTWFEEGE
jgi:hypothetical protein